MAHVSRQYIREKWNSAKWDIEECLQVNDKDIPDGIPKTDVEKCIGNIRHQFSIIIAELEKYKE